MGSSLAAPLLCSVLTTFASGCKVGPDYVRPPVVTPTAYKEGAGWKVATPGDERARGPWWAVFRDPELAKLESAVNLSNQNLAAAEAQYRSARAIVLGALAGYSPTIGASASVTRAHPSTNLRGGAISSSGGVVSTNNQSSANDFWIFGLPLSLSWEADIWGRVRRTVEAAQASAEASQADLASARLSFQAALAQNYFQLRSLDLQKRILDGAVVDFATVLQLTQNRYNAGVVGRSDVLQAQAQLETTRAQAIDLGVQRAQLEHAVATLIGVPASSFSLAPSPAVMTPPAVPLILPSEILEQRPDVAAAERRMAAANAQIGVAKAAYFPSLTLSGSGGLQSSSLSNLFSLPSIFWSVGPALAATLVDGGARAAQTDQARAAYDVAVATYRQTALTAFQDVEDNLAALRILRAESDAQAAAVEDSKQALTITMNQYATGTVGYLELLIAETTALGNERTAASILGRQMVATALLIKALGGGWQGLERPAATGASKEASH